MAPKREPVVCTCVSTITVGTFTFKDPESIKRCPRHGGERKPRRRGEWT